MLKYPSDVPIGNIPICGGGDQEEQARMNQAGQADRTAGRHIGRLASRQETKSLRQSEQWKKAKHGKQGGHKTSYHILMCDNQLKTACGNDQVQIWRKRLRNHRSVNTNIERKIKTLES